MAEKKVTTKPATKKISKKEAGLLVPLYNLTGKEVGTTELPKAYFAVPAPDSLIAQYVHVYLANQRQGTASTKTRSEITGSTKKIYRQKGTGRARHGANKAPIFVGGGVAFGPRPGNYTLSLTKKQRTKALLASLSMKLKDKNVVVVQDLAKATGKTKQMSSLFTLVTGGKKALFVYAPTLSNAVLGTSNIKTITAKDASVLNAYDVMTAGKVIFAQEGLDHFLATRQKNHEN